MPTQQRECECGRLFLSSRKDAIRCPRCRRSANRKRRAFLENSAPGSHSLKQWLERIESQRNLCYWCHCSLLRDGNFVGEKDHLTPLSRGGSQNIGNIVAACYVCNQEKHNRTWREYQQFLLNSLKGYACLSSTITSLPATKRAFRFESFENLLISIAALARRRRVGQPELDVFTRRLNLRAQIDAVLKERVNAARWRLARYIASRSQEGRQPGNQASVLGMEESVSERPEGTSSLSLERSTEEV